MPPRWEQEAERAPKTLQPASHRTGRAIELDRFHCAPDEFLVHERVPTDDFVAYHEARARGGTGLIVPEATAVHPRAF